MPVGEPKKTRRWDRHLAAERRLQKTRNLSRKICGPHKVLAVARRTSRRAKLVQHKQKSAKMSRRATVTRRMRGIFRPNATRSASFARHKIDILRSADQKKCGPHERLGFANTGTTLIAKVARRNRIPRKNWVKDSVLRGTVTRYMSGGRLQPQLKCSEGIKNENVGELLRLGKKRTTRTSGELRRDSTLLRYQCPPERQKRVGTVEG